MATNSLDPTNPADPDFPTPGLIAPASQFPTREVADENPTDEAPNEPGSPDTKFDPQLNPNEVSYLNDAQQKITALDSEIQTDAAHNSGVILTQTLTTLSSEEAALSDTNDDTGVVVDYAYNFDSYVSDLNTAVQSINADLAVGLPAAVLTQQDVTVAGSSSPVSIAQILAADEYDLQESDDTLSGVQAADPGFQIDDNGQAVVNQGPESVSVTPSQPTNPTGPASGPTVDGGPVTVLAATADPNGNIVGYIVQQPDGSSVEIPKADVTNAPSSGDLIVTPTDHPDGSTDLTLKLPNGDETDTLTLAIGAPETPAYTATFDSSGDVSSFAITNEDGSTESSDWKIDPATGTDTFEGATPAPSPEATEPSPLQEDIDQILDDSLDQVWDLAREADGPLKNILNGVGEDFFTFYKGLKTLNDISELSGLAGTLFGQYVTGQPYGATATKLATKIATTAAGATNIPFAGSAALGFISYGNMVVGSVLDQYSQWQTQQALAFAKDPILAPGQTPGTALQQPSITPQPIEGQSSDRAVNYTVPDVVAGVGYILDPSGSSSYTVTAASGSAAFSTVILPAMTGVTSYHISEAVSPTPLSATAGQMVQLNGASQFTVLTLDASGNPVVSPDPFMIDAQFTSSGTFQGSIKSTPVSLHGASSQYVVADSNGSLYLQDMVAGRDGIQTLPGVVEINFTDGTGLFDPTGSAEDAARIYAAALGRPPDIAGLEFWTAQVDDSHVPLSAVGNSFAASPEFIQHYGSLSDSAFINQLYENVLGREADASGAQFWDGQLTAGATRGTVVLGFAESPENDNKTLTIAGDEDNAETYRLYQASFDRTPDTAGSEFWAAALRGGTTSTEVTQDFISSAEFQQTYGALSDTDFVAIMYQNVLHRAADRAGQQFWTTALGQGSGRPYVLLGFSDSLENRLQTAGATHANWVFIPS
jgi:hypothetical protein